MRHQVEKKYNDKDKSNSAVEVKETGPQKEQSFWVLLEVKLNEVLTPNEVVKFIAEMKKVIVVLHFVESNYSSHRNTNWIVFV